MLKRDVSLDRCSGQMKRHIDYKRQIDRWMDGWIDRQIDRKIDRWIDGWIDR